MTKISSVFESLKVNDTLRQPALIPFITAGDPDLETTAAALQLLDRSGADLIELGIPYADPLADGPVIQAAATRALQRGTQLEQVLEMLVSTTPSLKAPVILFVYYNMILNCGIQPFLKRLVHAGVSGLVVPDLPLEEATSLVEAAAVLGIEVVLLVAPTSSGDRVQKIAQQSQGFIYLVSVTGVTGMRTELPLQVKSLLHNLRSITNKPIGLGFGISQPEQARQAALWGADAVIVGSAFVNRLAEGKQGLPVIEEFCRSLKAAIQLPSSSPTNPFANSVIH
jgi:tryptophan synthase alpha chain